MTLIKQRRWTRRDDLDAGRVAAEDGYKPGSQPPQGYVQWHAWASVQEKAGHRARFCTGCERWNYDFVKCGCTDAKRISFRTTRDFERWYGTHGTEI